MLDKFSGGAKVLVVGDALESPQLSKFKPIILSLKKMF